MMLGVTLSTMALLLCGVAGRRRLNVLYEWKTPEFVFDNTSHRQAMIDSGSYIPGNPFLIDVDYSNNGYNDYKFFMTTPRLLPGTPATLSTLSREMGANRRSPALKPYPNWEWNQQGNCDAITSVFRVKVDPCGRLWVIDSGRVDINTEFTQLCPPQIVVFNLRNNAMIRRYRIPSQDLRNDSLLINIAVDVRDNCRNTFAYISDVTEFGLIVYDANRNISWRVSSNLFGPDLSAAQYTIAGESFNLPDGIFGLALGPMLHGDRTLYFSSLASFRQSWVNTSVLRNESLFQNDTNSVPDAFNESPGTRPSQIAPTAMNSNAVLFFNLLSNTSLNCWNSRLPYVEENLVELVTDYEALQFVSGLKIVKPGRRSEALLALSCRFQRLMTGSFNTSEINFRVMVAAVDDLVRGTSCASRRGHY